MRISPAMALLAAVLAVVQPLGRAWGQAFDKSVGPARGIQEVILTIPSFGRYAVSVKSAQGVALQLVDRMAGPGDVVGAPGARDGRIDGFLERGSYKVRLIADARGSGTAALRVVPFTELQTAPVQLVENKPVVSTLGDDQQRSWWVVVTSPGFYGFEAGGRYLTDLRLWQDGDWIVNASPQAAAANTNPEQPWAVEQLTARLQPGVYRLTAYGGAGVKWAKASDAAPLMLRWGVAGLADSGRTTHVASAFGVDRFLVPGSTADLRLVLDKAQAADVSVMAYNPAALFDTSQAADVAMTKDSRDPVAEVPLTVGSQVPYLVTVTAKPGTVYRLEALNESGGAVTIPPGNSTLMAVTLPGNPDDEIDPGFILVNSAQNVVAASAINLDAALPWRRTFNLLGAVSTYIYTSKNVDLQIDGAGVVADFTVQRFTTTDDLAAPLPKPSGGVWTLTPGYYVLTAAPDANGRGVLKMSLFAAGNAPPVKDSPRLPAAVFADVQRDPVNAETLYSSLGDGAAFGLRQEALPAVLAAPLSMELAPGEVVGIPLAVQADAQLSVVDEAGQPAAFSVDGQAASGSAMVAKGLHQFSVTGARREVVTITNTPAALLASAPLPAIPESQVLPTVLPALTPGQATFINLGQNDNQLFEVHVAQDALYRFETTGLLATGGAIRTRTNPALQNAQGNGVGRNFLLQPFLREGDYQLAVSTQGQSAGHAGVSVVAAPLIDAGVLTPGQPARLTLPPGQAAAYRFHIAAAGTYHIYTLGLNHQFAMRLEDAEGWPLIAPGGAANETMDFAPGDYRMILLPGTVENRAVTMLQAEPPAVVYQGHGPFDVVFGPDLQNRWMEPAKGQQRVPDVWRFTLPAAATVGLTISNGMQAAVSTAAGAPVAVTGTQWSGRLAAGDYQIAATAVVPDNRLDYTLNLGLSELIPGQSESVQAPATIPVSLGGGAQYDIWSFGSQDVRAVLTDAAGHQVAANDDRDNDWNFLISGNFPPGAYKLDVEPVGADNAQTQVFITAPAAVTGAALQAGVPVSFADGLVHVLPLPAASVGSLVLAGVQAAVPVGLALQAQTGTGGWETVSRAAGVNPYVAMPAARGAYRLTVWAEDHGDSPVAVTETAVTPLVAGLGSLGQGLALQPVRLGGQVVYVAHVAVPSPMVLSLAAGVSDSLVWGQVPGVALARDGLGSIAAPGPFLWLADAAPDTVTAQPAAFGSVRFTLGDGQRLVLPVQAAGGPALWEAAAQGSQPGLAVSGGPMAVGASGLLQTALAFQAAGAGRLAVWQASGAGAVPLTLTRTSFAAPVDFTVSVGSYDGMAGAGAALRAALPAGSKRIALTLPQGMVAVLRRGGVTEAVLQGDGVAPDILDSEADTLLLLNAGAAAPYSVSLQLQDAPELVLRPGGLLTHYSATPAVLHIRVPAGALAGVHLGGAAAGVTAMSASGAVSSGVNAKADGGGSALVTVQPGLAVVSMDGPGVTDEAAVPVAPPGTVGLAGAHMTLLVPAGPAGPAQLVTVETDAPVIIRNAATGVPLIFPAGADAALFQPKGAPLRVELDAVGGQALSGVARLAAIPALPITEGLGPQVLAAPGQSRLFSFSLAKTQTIGVGVHGSVDDAGVRLLGADGSVLASGVIAMQKLPAGTYYLAVDVPADAAASVIQPALVGAVLPDDGPPADVQATYRGAGPQ